MFDIKNNIKLETSLAPILKSVDVNGTGVDLTGFSSASLVVNVGAAGDTFSGSVKTNLIIEDSDDNSTYTAVTSGNVTGGTTDSSGIFQTIDANGEAGKTYGIGYVGGKKWIRAVVDIVGTHSNGTIYGAVVVKGTPISAPVTSDANA
tara:strand:- start:4020 stop:4463 length:444 start_codon:yes stop_codon:yes gene_type:complete